VPNEEKQFKVNIRGENPLDAQAPLYSNFLGISRLGTDVQLEFVYVDINQLALITEAMKRSTASGPQDIAGKTVAKIVMPGANFVQLQEHLNMIFKALKEELQTREVGDELSTDVR
jgi:hypothetical protein